MRMVLFYLILLSFMTVSCKDYDKAFSEKLNSLQEMGYDILDYNSEIHTVVYNENGVIKLDNLDSCKEIFSYKNTYKTYLYKIDSDSVGKLTVNEIEKEVELRKNFESKASIKLNRSNEYSHVILEIKCKNCLKPEYGEQQTDTYRYNTRSRSLLIPILPCVDIVSRLKGKQEEKDNPNMLWYEISQDPFSLSYNFVKDYSIWEHVWQKTGKMFVYFQVSQYSGRVLRVFDKFLYYNESYDLSYQVNCFNNRGEALDFFKSINNEISTIDFKDDFIDIEYLHDKYIENRVQAERLYSGKRLKILIKLNEIKKNDNILRYLGYKYKSEQICSLLFGGHNIEVYTNDENFIKYDYPLVVYMEADFNSYADNQYIFTNCKLVMANKQPSY